MTDANSYNTSCVFKVTQNFVSQILDFRSMIYSNPEMSSLIVDSSKIIDEIKVADVTGRIVFARNQINLPKTTIDVSGLAEATYFIHIKTDTGKTTVKSFVKQ
ncbi:MAG: T9SS type A sorting domain-containing protein [Chitinophagales bacterium]|nr:T9SS type A sorting domain-containing protein [Chitinophagales bacterium]